VGSGGSNRRGANAQPSCAANLARRPRLRWGTCLSMLRSGSGRQRYSLRSGIGLRLMGVGWEVLPSPKHYQAEGIPFVWIRKRLPMERLVALKSLSSCARCLSTMPSAGRIGCGFALRHRALSPCVRCQSGGSWRQRSSRCASRASPAGTGLRESSAVAAIQPLDCGSSPDFSYPSGESLRTSTAPALRLIPAPEGMSIPPTAGIGARLGSVKVRWRFTRKV